MSRLLPLVLDALASGGIRVELGRIAGHSGYVDPGSRAIVLNPDASERELLAEIGHDLTVLARPDAHGMGPPLPELALVHSVEQADEPSPPRCRGPLGRQRQTSGFRVIS